MSASRLAALMILLLPIPALAAPCPVPGQKPMLLVKMYFGQDGVAAGAWEQFLSGTITPGFPDGLTVYPVQGQWMDPRTHRLSREESKVVEIAAPDTPAVRRRVAGIARDYRKAFHQQSVGIVTSPACAAF